MALTKVDISIMDNVGTTANKLLAYDGSGNLPAVDGSQLTNVATGITESSSDPTISTNPSGGVGTQWNNTTSGEVYICTDATAGENVWTNVGAGSGDVQPYSFIGESYGYCLGGEATNIIDRFPFATQINATDVGDLTQTTTNICGASSQTHGYTLGENASPGDYIGIVQFVATADGTDVGNLSIGRYSPAGCSSEANGYAAGGDGSSDNVIDKISFSSDGNGTDIANLTVGRFYTDGVSATDYGYVAGGLPQVDTIDRFPFATDSDATDVGNLSASRWSVGASTKGSQDYGYCFGSYPATNRIDKYALASSANGTDIADMASSKDMVHCCSATSYSYLCGGRPYQNTIEQFNTSTDANSTDWADLTANRANIATSQY